MCIVSKPLYVALAQRKEDRKAHLAQQYVQRVSGMRMQQSFGQVSRIVKFFVQNFKLQIGIEFSFISTLVKKNIIFLLEK